MSVESVVSPDGKKLTIVIKGRFDFSSHQLFRDAYERFYKAPDTYIVDLKDTTYLDSSALGMLLLLRDHAGATNLRSGSSTATLTCAKSSPSPTSTSCSTSIERPGPRP